jgi:hypothetical protein
LHEPILKTRGTTLKRSAHLSPPSEKPAPKDGILSELDLKILWVSRTLSNIDFQYEPEFIRLKQSPVHEDLKRLMREALTATYTRKRAPYVKLLLELRGQQHRSAQPKADA